MKHEKETALPKIKEILKGIPDHECACEHKMSISHECLLEFFVGWASIQQVTHYVYQAVPLELLLSVYQQVHKEHQDLLRVSV